MGQEKNEESPEHLGKAVAQKIESLFSALDSPDEEPESSSEASMAATSLPAPEVEPGEVPEDSIPEQPTTPSQFEETQPLDVADLPPQFAETSPPDVSEPPSEYADTVPLDVAGPPPELADALPPEVSEPSPEVAEPPSEYADTVPLDVAEPPPEPVDALPPEEPEPPSEYADTVPLDVAGPPPELANALPPEVSEPSPEVAEPPTEYADTVPLDVAELAPPPTSAADDEEKAISKALERIEALVLRLEWEMNPDAVRDLLAAFDEVRGVFPGKGEEVSAILNKVSRVLKRFTGPEAAPHPLLARLLQDSLSALKQAGLSKGGLLADGLLRRISRSCQEILAAMEPVAATPKVAARQEEAQDYGAIVGGVSGTVHSLEDVSRRLGRMLAVLRQGGRIPREEVARRLGTLESMLSARVGQLANLHSRLALMSPPPIAAEAPPVQPPPPRTEKTAADGLLIVLCEGSKVAVPSSLMAAMYPLSKEKGRALLGRKSIRIDNRLVRRYPMEASAASRKEKPPIPNWVIHVSLGKKDFFIPAERVLGYRRISVITIP